MKRFLLHSKARMHSRFAMHFAYCYIKVSADYSVRSKVRKAIDVSAIASGQAVERALDTRIVVVELRNVDEAKLGQNCQRAGLMVAQANETPRLKPVDTISVAGRYVQLTWQLSAGGEVVCQLAVDRSVEIC